MKNSGDRVVAGAKLKIGDRLTDIHGKWQVIQVHPPHGKRRDWLYTLLNDTSSMAEQVSQTTLFAPETNMKVLQPDGE